MLSEESVGNDWSACLLSLAGDTWHQRTVIQPTTADTMTAASYLSFGTVAEWKSVEIKYTRRTK